jgi:hypothetical protein
MSKGFSQKNAVLGRVNARFGREKGAAHGLMPRNFRALDIKRSRFPPMLHTTEQLEGQMDGRIDCCRYQPSLDDLLADEVMQPVLRSAGIDEYQLREMMVETARRIEDRERRIETGDAGE